MTNNQTLSAPERLHAPARVLDGPGTGAPAFAVVGHRGAMALAPENSAGSFQVAAAAGVDEIELDVRVTADGVPIVLHDPTLERLAAAPHHLADRLVRELSLAQVREVVLDSGHPVLTFADVLELTHVVLQVEIKDPSAVPALAGLLPASDLGRIKFSSFHVEALFLLALHLPAVPRGLIVSSFPATQQQQEELEDMLIITGASTLYTGFQNLSAGDVRRLQAADIEVHVWPLRSVTDVERALALNADGGTADDPGQAKAWLDIARAGDGVQPGAHDYSCTRRNPNLSLS